MFEMAHVCVPVKDLDESYKFYNSVFSFEKTSVKENENLKMIYINAGGVILELLKRKNTPYEEKNAGPVDHIAFDVDDFDGEIARLKGLGVKFSFDIPREFDGRRLIFIEGPSGEKIELMEK